MNKQSCGYHGHVCGLNRVQFISRAFDVNNYCVNGHRVELSDAGEFSESMAAEREAIRLFLLTEYAAYLRWHVEFSRKHGAMPIQPFNHVFAKR